MISLSEGIKNLLSLYQQKVSGDEKRQLQQRIKDFILLYILLRRLHSACTRLLFLIRELKDSEDKQTVLGSLDLYEDDGAWKTDPFAQAFAESATDVKCAYLRVRRKLEANPLDLDLLALYIESIETGIDAPLAWSGSWLLSPRIYYDRSWKSSIDYDAFLEMHNRLEKALLDFGILIRTNFNLSQTLSIQFSVSDVMEFD